MRTKDMKAAIDIARNLPRESVVAILREVSIECYDSEDTYDLREALVSNIEDGTIEPARLTDEDVA